MKTRTYRGWAMWWYRMPDSGWVGVAKKAGHVTRRYWRESEEELVAAMMRDVERAEGVEP